MVGNVLFLIRNGLIACGVFDFHTRDRKMLNFDKYIQIHRILMDMYQG